MMGSCDECALKVVQQKLSYSSREDPSGQRLIRHRETLPRLLTEDPRYSGGDQSQNSD